jgi:hypothetical protein
MNQKLTSKSTKPSDINGNSHMHIDDRTHSSFLGPLASKIITTAVSVLHTASIGEVSY